MSQSERRRRARRESGRPLLRRKSRSGRRRITWPTRGFRRSEEKSD